ncbi:ChuX/HutX family heme-like substrate-binding protein, partial [Rhizobium ruizarguesonis]
SGAQAAIVLVENIDLRIFPSRWEHGFAVSKKYGDQERLSLQYFDKFLQLVFQLQLGDDRVIGLDIRVRAQVHLVYGVAGLVEILQ